MNRLVGLVLIVAVTLSGCKATGPDSPALAKVSGIVNLDGKPMEGGEVRFNLTGQPTQILDVTNGAFSGNVFVGQNRIDVLWEKDGAPHPMEPDTFLKVNAVADEFSGPNSPFQQAISESGQSDLKFDVKSADR